MMQLEPCLACGGGFPSIEGPTHRYLESSPGCWAAYCEVLAREYSDPAYSRLHRLTVDSYSVQHPGRPSPQTIQSAAGHLVGLYMVLERGRSAEEATGAIGALTQRKGRYQWLTPPGSMGAVTVADVQTTASVEAHLACVQKWADSAWQAWTAHHDTVRMWADELAGHAITTSREARQATIDKVKP
ncbi:MAG TPA: DUF5946 family protein [Candidatus Angelobacter sp.]|nr:DUF5946 family protein [Candidatus Angelobacter sp.]